ncbi:hypothetical protein [Bowmanella pacifica]|uniref:Uncharacterized protein n=1 Tax=Bowmanella pacifica TaxID=502051 RepID=A0A918DM99_9ALTE|nr:hypothetical protein [Bowmanella pacifica]GGO75100.1 hypothetical protein GCM10010982_39480 [Bowmanella pacifica]
MPGKSLPAQLRQVLENHVEQSDLVYDEELKGIFERLNSLNDQVERLKANIHQKRLRQEDNP